MIYLLYIYDISMIYLWYIYDNLIAHLSTIASMEIFEDRQKKSENPKHDRIAKCQQTPGERHRLEQHPKVSKSWDL